MRSATGGAAPYSSSLTCSPHVAGVAFVVDLEHRPRAGSAEDMMLPQLRTGATNPAAVDAGWQAPPQRVDSSDRTPATCQ